MNYLDIFTCHKTVLKAFINIPATPPVASLLQGVSLCSKRVCVRKNTIFSSLQQQQFQNFCLYTQWRYFNATVWLYIKVLEFSGIPFVWLLLFNTGYMQYIFSTIKKTQTNRNSCT